MARRRLLTEEQWASFLAVPDDERAMVRHYTLGRDDLDFPTEDAALKLVYLAIRNFEKKGRAVREWVAARNQFAIMFGERFTA